MIGNLDLLSLAVLVGRQEKCLAEASLSLGQVVVLKVGMGMVLVLLLAVLVGLVTMSLVMVSGGLLAVTGAMLLAVLGVQCLELVMLVDSLLMLSMAGGEVLMEAS